MAYPEPIPEIKGEHAKEFLRRLESFRLTPAQKKLFKGADEYYLKKRPKE